MASTKKKRLEKHAEIAGAIVSSGVGFIAAGPVGGILGGIAGFYLGREVEDLILESNKKTKTRKR